ncbi:hypothetical protein GT037_010813 [Alternaria burnsii]|uniref:Uncharacterized protein n=1 Tax=Alternaria burnsii TaxID=1187904 RepID=A0A8H7ATI1_9PLEO|nr:uncharacterized protein GT037_010813 [Alternaria burnsii]KAF7671032.1 hypothetical protein GT037_010813 [Alternaria burnsii]
MSSRQIPWCVVTKDMMENQPIVSLPLPEPHITLRISAPMDRPSLTVCSDMNTTID